MDILQFYESDIEKKIYFDKDDSDLTWTSMAHYHRAIELSFAVKDSLMCCVNGDKFMIEPGEAAFIDSFDVHYFSISKGSSRYALVIGVEFLNDFYKQYGKKNNRVRFPQKLFDKEKNKKIFSIIQEWGECFETCNELQNLGYVNLLFGTMAAIYEIEYSSSENDSLVVKILTYINEHFREQIDLKLLAEKFGYSKSTVSRAVSSAIGEDLRTYVNLIRARNVHKLLENDPETTVTAAASESGFNSMKTFYRAYAQVFDEHPKIKGKL